LEIMVLDIMLPDGNGLDLLKKWKEEKPETGVLIISAKNSLDDKLTGLDWGADDYLTKPFHLPELNARVKAIYRRRNFNGNNMVEFNEITINPDNVEVFVNDNLLSLTRKEYELLLYFLVNKNRVLTKQSIAEHLWGEQIDLYDSFDFVYQHIKNLRKKLTQAGGKDYITTVYGIGYKFNTRIS
ncbi:MAG: response regulator transcription factor, partial [Bacteroidetes bacterium]|nr:response regulator transcription factor [Bacteroidota bacterium]